MGVKNPVKNIYPNTTAEASDKPIAADFPRPRPAVKVTVLRRVFSEITSINFRTDFACRYKSYKISCVRYETYI